MSRTYRRKSAEFYYNEEEALKPYSYAGYIFTHYNSKKEYIRDLRIFNSDSGQTMQQVPKWYKVYFCRRPYKAKEKVALINERKQGYRGEIPFPVIKKDANYYW